MEDLFYREQQIYEDALSQAAEVREGTDCRCREFRSIVKEYGRLLKQLRMVTKISDRTTDNLNTSKLDLLDKVHYDGLTGIYNRRYLEESLHQMVKSEGVLSVMMVDVDFFKKYNDTYGHFEGDATLRAVAVALAGNMTDTNSFAARYGGEEFAVVMPGTDEAGARLMAERLLKSVQELGIPHVGNSAANCLTISIGVTTGIVELVKSEDTYIKRADEALYISKQSGRNRYTFLNCGEVTK